MAKDLRFGDWQGKRRLPFLREVGPEAGGEILAVEAGIEAFADAGAVEIGFPESLE